MICEIARQTDFDALYWVPLDKLHSRFNQADLSNRNVIEIKQAYLRDWFEITDARKAFIPPVVQLIAGQTQFINGRHRLAVLSSHLGEVPIAFYLGSTGIEDWIRDLKLQRVNELDTVNLPDLPIFDSLSMG